MPITNQNGNSAGEPLENKVHSSTKPSILSAERSDPLNTPQSYLLYLVKHLDPNSTISIGEAAAVVLSDMTVAFRDQYLGAAECLTYIAGNPLTRVILEQLGTDTVGSFLMSPHSNAKWAYTYAFSDTLAPFVSETVRRRLAGEEIRSVLNEAPIHLADKVSLFSRYLSPEVVSGFVSDAIANKIHDGDYSLLLGAIKQLNSITHETGVEYNVDGLISIAIGKIPTASAGQFDRNEGDARIRAYKGVRKVIDSLNITLPEEDRKELCLHYWRALNISPDKNKVLIAEARTDPFIAPYIPGNAK